MGVMDKFLNYMKIVDEDEYDTDEDYLDDTDDYADEPPRKAMKESEPEEKALPKRPAAKVTPMPIMTTNALDTSIGGYAPFMYSGAIIARRIRTASVLERS